MADQYMRNPDTLIAGNRSGAVLIGPDGSALYLRKQTDLVFKLVELLREPRFLGEIEGELQVSAAEVERLIALLEKRRIILRDVPEKLATLIPPVPRTAERLCQNVVVGICGAVQAATSVPLLVAIQRTLAKEVDVVLTDSAEKFVKPEALSYFGFRVWNDMYQTQGGANVPHIHLATQADLVLVVPATAHAIHRVSSGACSDLLSLIISATQAPVVVVPTMNTAMLQYAPIRRNIEQLRASGIYVVEPGLGCEVSKGHDDAFRFCGIGLTEANIFRGLAAIVTAHRELAAGRSSTGVVPSRVRALEQTQTGAVPAEKLQEPA